jgi:hypothetical protein
MGGTGLGELSGTYTTERVKADHDMALVMNGPSVPDTIRSEGNLRTRLTFIAILLLAFTTLTAIAVAAETSIDQDLVVDDKVEWKGDEHVVSANVTVAAGGTLEIKDITVTFESPSGAPLGIVVEPDGVLDIRNATLQAREHPYFLSSDGQVTVRGSHLSGLFSQTPSGGSFTGIAGGVVANGGSIDLRDVTIEGGDGIHVTAFDAEVMVDGLHLVDGGYGLLMGNIEGVLRNVVIENTSMAMVTVNSTVTLEDVDIWADWTLWSIQSDLTIRRMFSNSSSTHLALENGTAVIEDSTFVGGASGVMALLGYAEVLRSTFVDTEIGIELLYAEGRIRDVLVDNCTDVSIVLSFVGFASEVPIFELDNVTIKDGEEAAISVESSADLVFNNLTIEGCADGINLASSTATFIDTVIQASTQCRPTSCSTKATGTGLLVETSAVELFNVSILESNGPAVSTYYSLVNATSSRFVDGNASGIILVYSTLNMVDSEVSGNAHWGVEVMGFPLDPEELDGRWGNTRADIRMNVTFNAKVVDQNGQWLSHAEVTAKSGDQTVGPYVSGFGGATQTFELPLFEYTYGAQNRSFNPWTFDIVSGTFANTSALDLEAGVSQITLVVDILRGDLVVDELRVAKTTEPDKEVTLRATVANVGVNTVESALLTFYYRNEAGFQRVIDEVGVGPIDAGETVEGTVKWTPVIEGDFIIVAFVDVDDLVDEEDEDNNREERPMKVREQADDTIPGPGVAIVVAVLALAAIASLALYRRRY